MQQWSWRQHAVVCAVLVGALLPLGLAGPAEQVLIPAALWVGGTGAISTALVALWRPRPSHAWRPYVVAGLLALVGLVGLTSLGERIGTGGPDAAAQAVADAVTLDALTIEGDTASVSITTTVPTRLRHLTLRSQDGYCEGTEWPADAPISGGQTFRVAFRCAGGVATSRSWRLSTVAAQGDHSATLVWSSAPERIPRAIVRPLP